MSRSVVANGNIKPYRFVKPDTTADFKVLQASTGEVAIGVSQPATHLPPWTPLDDGYAGVAGIEIMMWEENDECLLIAGTGGVTNGDQLKSDSDGKAVTASATDNAGAYALQTATAGQIFRAKVTVHRKAA